VSHFGIDFGTTNSGAFEIDGASKQHFGDEQGKPLPSIVVIDRATGQPLGGRDVWNHRLSYREKGGFRVVPPLKTLLDDADWREGRWTVPELVAIVLGQLSRRAVAMGVRNGIKQATFSIPVGLKPKARRILREAARIAGIKVTAFVNESTAALMCYWTRVRDYRNVAVFDWGGGTLDVSVLELRGHTIYERYAQSMPRAGIHIDEDLAQFAHTRIMQERGTSISFEEVTKDERNEMMFRCELAKCALSRKQETELALESYGQKPARLVLTRQTCAPVITPYVRQAVDMLMNAIRMAHVSRDEIQEIIVIGGSSQLWLLHESLGREFLGKYKLADDFEWDVAHGTAIVEQNPGKFTLAETLGLRLSDDSYFDLARPGDRPAAETTSLALSLVEEAPAANIIIDKRRGDHSQPTAALQFSVPTMGFDQEEIRLEYRLTEDLTFHIMAQSKGRGPRSMVERETGELHFGYQMG